MTNIEVAKTIADQLGGRALFMLGAKNLVGDERSLTFRVARNACKVTHIRITLQDDDTYHVLAMQVRKHVVTERGDFECQVGELHATIETLTGLYLSLGTMGRVAS